MNVVQTRTSHNLAIHRVRRRPDQKVEITFSILQAGIWQSARMGCRVRIPPATTGYLMTPAINDPAHAVDPLMVPNPGAVFTWIWDAPMDGYRTGTLSGLTFELAYVDVFCCEEIEPSGGTPPVTPPPIPPPNPPIPPPPPGPGIPAPTPPPTVPTIPRPGYGHPDRNAGTTEPPVEPQPTQPPGSPSPTPTAPFVAPGGSYPTFPLFGIFGSDDAPVDRFGRPVAPAATRTPSWFSFTRTTPTRAPAAPTAGGSTPIVVQVPVTPTPGTQQTANTFGMNVPSQVAPYPVAPGFSGLFALPNSVAGLQVTAFLPVYALPQTQRSVLYFALKNLTGGAMQGIQAMVFAVAGDGTTRLIQSSALIQATSSTGAAQPPGTVPPGTSVGDAICINWDQLPAGPALFLVALANQAGSPFVGGKATGVAYPMGSVPPPNSQVPELLGPGLKHITGFPSYMTPTYEGSVNAVGDEDTYVFEATRTSVPIVLQVTQDAKSSGFLPQVDVYDVEDMDTPIISSVSRFQIGGVDLEPEYHEIGLVATCTVGNRYAIVVRNQSAHYSRRWQFRLFHAETVPGTGGTLSVDGSGNLAGDLSCAYGRQSIQLLNDRTGEAIFVRTNERGVTDDIQRDTKSGTPSRKLAVASGDKIDVVRPGPGVLYRRSADLIGQGQIS